MTVQPILMQRLNIEVISVVFSLGLLWVVLIDHLSVEWTLEVQYHYGWAVPVLCVYLIWRRLAERWTCSQVRWDRRPNHAGLIATGLVIAIGCIRLIQKPNPEWRILSLALAIASIALSLLVLRVALGAGEWKIYAFPIAFFLVSVPWLRPVESFVIQTLSQVNGAAAVDLVGLFGIPAIQQGNVIEISSGLVGIDEACSGIRSVQATLMLSLFLGEVYRLSPYRRMALVLGGLILSLILNMCRTALLTCVAAKQGMDGIAAWHDPAGITILVGCFFGLWLLGMKMRSKIEKATASRACPLREYLIRLREVWRKGVYRNAQQMRSSLSLRYCLVLSSSIIFIECGTELWYRWLDAGDVNTPRWTIIWPEQDPFFKRIAFAEAKKLPLKSDVAEQGEWIYKDGSRCHAIYLEWLPGKSAAYLAKRHTPDICLPAVGFQQQPGVSLWLQEINGIKLLFRHYRFRQAASTVHVFHCRWDPAASLASHVADESSRFNLLRSVWTGRGQAGQIVLEFAMWGLADSDAAEAALREILQTLIVLKPTPQFGT